MDTLRLLTLAGSIGAAMAGGLYAAATRAELPPSESVSSAAAPAPALAMIPMEAMPAAPAEEAAVAEIPVGLDVPDEAAALVEAYADEILDDETGLRIGPVMIVAATEHAEAEETADEPTRVRAARRAPRAPAAPIVRLHADPGRHVILTARGMMSRGETVTGSCYRYLSEVFARAGHDGWRNRTIVYREGSSGPYANLDLVRPGDWLYIVNHPESTPVGTHSVLFVGWEDRARGYARVIEHSGWGAGASAGQERTYDVSRTYRIVRPILARDTAAPSVN